MPQKQRAHVDGDWRRVVRSDLALDQSGAASVHLSRVLHVSETDMMVRAAAGRLGGRHPLEGGEQKNVVGEGEMRWANLECGGRWMTLEELFFDRLRKEEVTY